MFSLPSRYSSRFCYWSIVLFLQIKRYHSWDNTSLSYYSCNMLPRFWESILFVPNKGIYIRGITIIHEQSIMKTTSCDIRQCDFFPAPCRDSTISRFPLRSCACSARIRSPCASSRGWISRVFFHENIMILNPWRIRMYAIYGLPFTINIPPMLAYIPYIRILWVTAGESGSKPYKYHRIPHEHPMKCPR